MKIAYFRPSEVDTGSEDGGQIYHRKLLAALKITGLDVIDVEVETVRHLYQLPLWAHEVSDESVQIARRYVQEGYVIVVSHENIFSLATKAYSEGCKMVVVVHNYLPRFWLKGNAALSLAYRLGAKRYFKKTFQHSHGALFVGHGDFQAAQAHTAASIARQTTMTLAQIPPAKVAVNYSFNPTLVHFDGSEIWLPKKLSRLTEQQQEYLRNHYTLEDYLSRAESGFTVIVDKFDVGFKLKLMQALYCGDFILSRVDLHNEVQAICPGYRWYRTFGQFDELKALLSDQQLIADANDDKRREYAVAIGEHFTWEALAESLVTLINSGDTVSAKLTG
ncbi:MAG: hypothetical protein AB8B87_26560 [Granulosicoccus sp.]